VRAGLQILDSKSLLLDVDYSIHCVYIPRIVMVYIETIKKKSGQKKPLTVTEAARQLGVHRVYLSNVIHGLRKSKSLTARYREVCKSHNAS
jgi:hypothetical protein